ncbi:MAG: hypothetical protein FWC75_05790 [Oscillospiraceae bacterium]|nr:hypothetical protein [Oscillospiraceae bacterium]
MKYSRKFAVLLLLFFMLTELSLMGIYAQEYPEPPEEDIPATSITYIDLGDYQAQMY